MADNNKGRGLEQIAYGLPTYPVSTTADGRIVGELIKGREQDRSLQSASLEAQKATLAELRRLHGAQQVSAEALRQDPRTLHVFQNGFEQLQRSLHEQQQAAVDQLRANREGFRDISEQQSRTADALEALRGPALPGADFDQLTSTAKGFGNLLTAYSKGILGPDARRRVEQFVDQSFGREVAVGDPDAASIFREPSRILRTPSRARMILNDLSHTADQHGIEAAAIEQLRRVQQLLTLRDRASARPLDEDLAVALSNAQILSPEFQHQTKLARRDARRTGSLVDTNYHLEEILGQGDTLISQGRRQIDLHEAQLNYASAAQGQRATANRHLARIADDSGDILSTMVDLFFQNNEIIDGIGGVRQAVHDLTGIGTAQLAQAEIANHQLSSILHTAIASQGTLVNIEGLTARVYGALTQGFHNLQLSQRELIRQSALTRAAVVTALDHLGMQMAEHTAAIIQQIRGTNQLLTSVIDRLDTPGATAGREKVRQASTLLGGAQEKRQIARAQGVFNSALEEDPTSTVAYMGAGLASEMLGELETAREHFRDVATYETANSELVSKAHERRGTIWLSEGNFPEAIHAFQLSLDANPQNDSARWQLAKCHALTAQEDDCLGHCADLLASSDHFLLHLLADSSFQNIDFTNAFNQAYDAGHIEAPEPSRFYLEHLLNHQEDERCQTVFRDLLASPSTLLSSGLITHAQFQDQLHHYARIARQSSPNLIITLTERELYALTVLLHRLEVREEHLAEAALAAIEKNPATYNSDKSAAMLTFSDTIKSFAGPNYQAIMSDLKVLVGEKYPATASWLFNS